MKRHSLLSPHGREEPPQSYSVADYVKTDEREPGGVPQHKALFEILFLDDLSMKGCLELVRIPPARCHLKLRQAYAGVTGAFAKVGVEPLRRAYEHLCDRLNIDTLILVDGGTDILMRGDEAGLGTPAEDMTSLAAASRLSLERMLVSCIGFGVDAFHGVCHAHFLENVAGLDRDGGYLGAHSLHLTEGPVADFRDAVELANARMPRRPSIVNSSIVSALEGFFGDVHRTDRTEGSTLFINPLMAMYWHFDLLKVVRRSLYLSELEGTETVFDVNARIERFRHSVVTRKRAPIPV